MKFTQDEQNLIDLIRAAGGSICPSDGLVLGASARRLLRRLERKGALTIEAVDSGFRYTVRGGGNG